MDGQSKSTASEFSSFGAVPAKRYRQTEAANRSRFAEIFAVNGMDKTSSDNGFCHQVFPTPLYEEDEDGLSPLLPTKPNLLNASDKVMKLGDKQESLDLRSPSPQKANLKQISDLLDDDEECFCRENMQYLAL